MYCRNCGTQLSDDARFCFGCGTPTGNSAPAGNSAPQQRYEAPAVPKKPKKKVGGLIAAVAAIAVVVAAVAGLAFSGILGGDTAKVAAAVEKSTKAFTDAANSMELTDLSAIVESKKVSEDISLWINEVEGSSAMKGIGVRLSVDSNLPGRNVAMAVTPFFGSADLVNVQMKMMDSEIYLGSPELTGGKFYMINTKTMCRDLENMGADLDEAANISFNIFDIIEKAEKLYSSNDDLTKAIKKAAAELFKNVEIEKSGTEAIEVNGKDLKCTAYDVVITKDSMHKFLTTVEQEIQKTQDPKAMMDLMASIGLPADVIDEMEYTLEESTGSISEAFTEVHEAVEALGDIKLQLYLNGGYVVAAVYENSFGGTDAKFVLNIGGGKNYVDDISLSISADDEAYRIISTGNHAGTGNTYSDETVVEYVSGSRKMTLAELNTTFAPKQTSDNLSIKLQMDSVVVQLRGQLTCKKDSMNLHLDKIALSEDNEKLAVLGMELSIGKYESDNINVKNHIALAKMTQDDLMDAAQAISDYASDWAMSLDSDLQEILEDIAYELF